jgi:mono/diheme cytochrome c family protein
MGPRLQFHGEEMNDLVAYLAKSNPPGERKDASGDAARGWAVFQAQCLPCHSVGGHGGNVGPPLGPERDLPLNSAEFAGVLWNHKRANPVLKGNEMADLTAFLASLRYVEPSGSRFVGERIFAERGCSYCHGPRAEGNQFGPRLGAEGDAYTIVSFTAALWKHGPKMVDRVQAMHISWPELEPSDAGNLIAFLNSPRP